MSTQWAVRKRWPGSTPIGHHLCYNMPYHAISCHIMPYHSISFHIIPCDAIWCQIILANVTTIPIIIMHQYLLFFLKHLFIFFHGQVLPGGVDPSARCLLFFEEIRWAVVRSLPGFFCRFCFCSLNHGGSQLTSFFLSWPVFLPFLLFSLNHGGSQLTRFFRSLPGFFLPFLFFSTLNLGIFQAFDGDKFVCMDSYSPTDCLVYSFGIRFGHPRGVQSWRWAKRHPCIHILYSEMYRNDDLFST